MPDVNNRQPMKYGVTGLGFGVMLQLYANAAMKKPLMFRELRSFSFRSFSGVFVLLPK